MHDANNLRNTTEQTLISSSDRGDLIKFKWGNLSLKEIRAILDALPLDINLVDSDDVIRYYNESGGQIFKRSEKVIGNKVQLCHPEAVRQKVTGILDDFRQGRVDTTETRGEINGRPTRWRYIALRDPNNKYIGALCITDHLDA
jgi:uncharacterized protein